jgi:mannose-6-phosphate isomerase
MSLEGEKKKLFITELVSKAKEFDEDTFHWVLKLYETYPDDSAIAAPLYLNLVQLKPGQALYLSAGELHAYLDGMGMELMASSDNVLRGGLTPKYIDREELKKILNFSGADPEILSAGYKIGAVSIYNSPSREFQLSRIDVDENYDYLIGEKNRVQILFISDGDVVFLSEKGESISAVKGESLFIPSHAGNWTGRGKAVLFRASVPGDND